MRGTEAQPRASWSLPCLRRAGVRHLEKHARAVEMAGQRIKGFAPSPAAFSLGRWYRLPPATWSQRAGRLKLRSHLVRSAPVVYSSVLHVLAESVPRAPVSVTCDTDSGIWLVPADHCTGVVTPRSEVGRACSAGGITLIHEYALGFLAA